MKLNLVSEMEIADRSVGQLGREIETGYLGLAGQFLKPTNWLPMSERK